MKKNKIDVIDGFGKPKPGKKSLTLPDKDNKVTEIQCRSYYYSWSHSRVSYLNHTKMWCKVIGYRQLGDIANTTQINDNFGSGAIS
jgi:hypothetical protein